MAKKKKYNIFDGDKIENIEDFVISLFLCNVSLRSMEGYQTTAFRKGLLDEDAQEISKTICWEIRRLMALYQQMLQMIQEITPMKEDEIIKELKKHLPELDIIK